MPIAEPAGDIRAQLAAVMDPDHPKRACFVVPEDAGQVPYVLNAYIEARPEGVLVTRDLGLALLFRDVLADTDAFDRRMALILGYPEAKPDVVAACDGNPLHAWAAQARDAGGNVVQECFVTPDGARAACDALWQHVPVGGELVMLRPADAIWRRVMLRQA